MARSIEPNDPSWDRLTAAAARAKSDPAAWLAMSDIYGDLARAPRFADAFARWLRLIWAEGTASAISRYLA